VRYGGTDPITGVSRSSTEELGFVLDYGKQDWQELALALREFISNAIDRSIREKGDWSEVKVKWLTSRRYERR
jgi:anti-sigma regulatory factor (Ser/Thr protein kinase)